MISYCLPEIPKVYWINRVKYTCNSCGCDFELLLPNGNDLVKYSEVDGIETRWLPTYGKVGYLDLMSKLIPSHGINDEITMRTARKFDATLRNYIEPSSGGNLFTLAENRRMCLKCKSKDLKLIDETTLTTPKVDWLKISCDLVR